MSPRPRRLALFLAAHLALGFAASAFAEKPVAVLLPVQIYNDPDLERAAPGLAAALETRLTGAGYLLVSSATAADGRWAVRTTISRFGAAYSLDGTVEPVNSSDLPARAYERADSAEALLPALEALAAKLRASLEAMATHPAAAQPAETPAAPRPVPSAESAVAAPAPAAPQPLPAGESLAASLQHPRTGPAFSGQATSVLAVDVDGDAQDEVLLLVDGTLLAFRDDGRELVELSKVKTARNFSPLYLSAGDLDGDGRAEVFAAGTQDERLLTQAYRWNSGSLEPVGAPLRAFARVLSHPEQGVVLAGMVGEAASLFAPGVRTFSWRDDGYSEGPPLAAPDGALVTNLDWHRLEPGGKPLAVVTDPAEFLRLYDGQQLLFRSADRVKGTRTELRGSEKTPGYLDEERYRVEGRTLAWEDGKDVYLFVQRNLNAFGVSTARIPNYSHGQVIALRWDGLTLSETASSPKIPGWIPDLDLSLASTPNRTPTLYAALVQSEGLLFPKRTTRLLAYQLPGAAR